MSFGDLRGEAARKKTRTLLRLIVIDLAPEHPQYFFGLARETMRRLRGLSAVVLAMIRSQKKRHEGCLSFLG